MSNERINTRVSGILIRDGSVLLIRYRYKNEPLLWHIPGGSVESYESLRRTVEREYYEELRIKVKACSLLFIYDNVKFYNNKSHHVIHLIFEVKQLSEAVPKLQLREDSNRCGIDWMETKDLKAIRLYPDIQEYIVGLLQIYPEIPQLKYICGIENEKCSKTCK